MTDTYELISDLHKDTYGFRPSQSYLQAFYDKSPVEQEAEWNSLCVELERREAEDRAQEQRSLEVFEARIQDMVCDFNISEATAIRWDMDAFEVDIDGALAAHCSAEQEIEQYLWTQGIAFKEWPRLVALIKDELNITT